jgi:hypothetical protein
MGKSMKNYQDVDVDHGLAAGLKRFDVEFPGQLTKNIRDFINNDFSSQVRDTMRNWPADCEPRFVKLATEMLSLAAAVRVHRAEAALGDDDFLCSLGFLSWLFNSFKHQ